MSYVFFDIFTAQVENVVVETLSATIVRVSWDRVPDITDYVVYYRQTSNTLIQTQEMSEVVASSDTSVIIDGLVSRDTYVFQVVARVTIKGKSVSGDRAGQDSFILTTALLSGQGGIIQCKKNFICLQILRSYNVFFSFVMYMITIKVVC